MRQIPKTVGKVRYRQEYIDTTFYLGLQTNKLSQLNEWNFLFSDRNVPNCDTEMIPNTNARQKQKMEVKAIKNKSSMIYSSSLSSVPNDIIAQPKRSASAQIMV